MAFVCEVCGNEIDTGITTCPFCGSSNESSVTTLPDYYVQKTVNLEMGRPVLEVALNRMTQVIAEAKRNKVNILTLIHGYGSSGKGGVIRTECRKNLDFMKIKGRISDYVCGEDFNKHSGVVKSLLRRYPELASDHNMNRDNKGITLVIF